MLTPTQAAFMTIERHGDKAEERTTEHAFGYEPGPQRDFWLEVLALIPEVRKAIAEDEQGA